MLRRKRETAYSSFLVIFGSHRMGSKFVFGIACAVKAGAFQWETDPPGNWFVPPGNNRSGGGGDKAVGAFDVKGRLSGSVSM
jgi:hypothetical protein